MNGNYTLQLHVGQTYTTTTTTTLIRAPHGRQTFDSTTCRATPRRATTGAAPSRGAATTHTTNGVTCVATTMRQTPPTPSNAPSSNNEMNGWRAWRCVVVPRGRRRLAAMQRLPRVIRTTMTRRVRERLRLVVMATAATRLVTMTTTSTAMTSDSATNDAGAHHRPKRAENFETIAAPSTCRWPWHRCRRA